MSGLHQNALESVNIGVLAFDESGRLLYMNPAAEEILRVSAHAFRGKHYRMLFRGSPAAVRIARKAFSENIAVTGFDVKLPLPGGQAGSPPLSFILGAAPLSGPGDERSGVVLSVLPAEILTMVEREERAATSAEEMQMVALGLAHEIRNPLGGILGAAQWLLRGEIPPGEREEGIRLILREAGRIDGLVEKMLEMGRSRPKPKPFPLLPLLREAAELLGSEARARGKGIAFDLLADPSLPDLSGHRDMIFQAVVNVLKNAVEAIEGDGTIRIDARMNFNYRFGRNRGRKRSFIEIALSDTGPGMTEEDARKAFLPFYTTKPKGTGLGLVMARQAVTRHGGKMEIKSVRGSGTTVRISLPVDPGKKPPT